MHQLKKQGVTIILVSHAHTQVMQLCNRALWVHKGITMHLGPSKEVVGAYLSYLDEQNRDESQKAPGATKKQEVQVDGAQKKAEDGKKEPAPVQSKKQKSKSELFGPIYATSDCIRDLHIRMLVNDEETTTIPIHSAVTIEYEFTATRPIDDLNVTLGFFREDGERMSAISTLNGDLLVACNKGTIQCSVHIADFNLAPGHYVLIMPIHEGHSYLFRDIVLQFTVTNAGRMVWGNVDFSYTYSVEQRTLNYS